LAAYQDERLPITAKIVMANRENGSDEVFQVAHDRAPNGFKYINDIIPQEELGGIGLASEGAIADFEIESINELIARSEGTARPLSSWIGYESTIWILNRSEVMLSRFPTSSPNMFRKNLS
jgi:hypothetical protein